ncbi:hypothetical protein, partial [Natronogracilivirga saccharolytica]
MKKTALVWLALLVIVSGCGIFGSDKEDEEQWENGYALIETNDEAFPIIIGHESGMNFAMGYSGDEIDKVVVWEKDREEDVLVFYMDAKGLPEKVIADGYIFLFENYDFSENVVDMAMISPDGEISTERAVPIPEMILEKSFGGTIARLVSIGMDVGVCAVGIKTAKLGVGLALLPSCGSAVLSGIAMVTDSDAFRTASAAWSTAVCHTGLSLADCTGITLEVVARGFDSAEERKEEGQSEIASASGVIRFGGVWQYPDRPDDWFVVEKERVYDALYNNNQNCYVVTIGEFVGVDGNVFTYQVPPDNFRIDLVYTRLNEDELHVERIDPPLELTMSRSTTQNPEYFITNRCGQAASFKESEPGL